MCLLGLGLLPCSATPGRAVWVCVFCFMRSACTPPLLAGVCGVGVCASARVSAAPQLLLSGVLGCVSGCVRAPRVPYNSWLGCAVSVCVLELRFRLRPATPGSVVGLFVCLCARSACTPPLPAGVCGVGVCARVRVSAAPRHSCLGCPAVCVFVCALRLYPATPDWDVLSGCICLGSACCRAPPLLAGVLGCVFVCVHAQHVPRHPWLGCALWACVLGLGFQLRPATPGWVVWVCVCLCARSACTLPLQAGVCGVGVCAWARVAAAPRHSWLRCWGVCVLVCALRLYPATPGWGVRCERVCLGSGFCCAPPLLAGLSGCVCVCVRAPLVPCHSRLGWAVWACVLGLGSRLRPASPGWGPGVCVCLCASSACTPPLLAGVCDVGVCAWAWVSAAPRQSQLGLSWCVCVCVRPPLVPCHSRLGCAVWAFVLGLGSRLRPATPGWGTGVCVCLCARSACTPPLLAGVCDVGVCSWARFSAAPRHSWLGCLGVCVFVCVLRLYPATPGRGVRCGCVCLGSGCCRAPPLLGGFLGCVLVCVRAQLVPRHSWLGRAVWVCLLGLGFRLRPATPGWGVGVCVWLCARSACTLQFLARVCGLGVCAWAQVPAAARHSWFGCWAVCVFVCALRL